MKASRGGSELSLSATDLSGFNECEHKIVLELAVALGELDRPGENELERRMLEKRGFEHEARVFEYLAATRKDIAEISMGPSDASRAEAVRDYLVEKGIAADRITVVALGETTPLVPNARPDGSDDPEARARNRRVEVAVDLPPKPVEPVVDVSGNMAGS